MRPEMLRAVLVSVGVGLAVGLSAPCGLAQGVDVDLLPSETSITTGQQFDLEVVVPDTSAQFNGFELEIDYDVSALTLISNQEGALMTAACGNRFHDIDDPGGAFSVTDAFLCAGVRVSGPGVIYRLTFEATATNTITTVILRSAGFSDGGVRVTPITTSNALVRIGDVTGLPVDPDGPSRILLQAPYPNPFTRAVHLGFWTDGETAARLDIYSVSGRRVRTLVAGDSAPGSPQVLRWDGTDEQGRGLPPGVYLVRLVAGDRIESRRMVKIE